MNEKENNFREVSVLNFYCTKLLQLQNFHASVFSSQNQGLEGMEFRREVTEMRQLK